MLSELETLLASSHSINDITRGAAEQRISSSYAQPDFAIALLTLVASTSHSDTARLDASIHFSRAILRHWPSPDADNVDYLQPIDRAIIKRRLYDIFINAPPCIQGQLAEALGAAAAYDPVGWNPPVLTSIIFFLNTAINNADFTACNPFLAALSSLFSRIVHLDPNFSIQDFADTHLRLFKDACNNMQANTTTAPCPTFETLRLCCDIFYHLKSTHCPHYFKHNLKEWRKELCWFLSSSFQPNVECDGAPDALRAAILCNLRLYIERHGDELKEELEETLYVVWELLTKRKDSGGQLVMLALRCFSAVAESPQHVCLQHAVVHLCDYCVHNVELSDKDEEFFKVNPLEYVEGEAKENDSSTLRGAACRLLRGLATNYWEQMVEVMSKFVKQKLDAYPADREKNWKEKYAAIYLVITLRNTDATGDVRPMVDMRKLFTNVIVSELQAPEPMLKAIVLKFLNDFVDQIPKDTALQLLPSIVRFVAHDSFAVHSYAASFIEKLLIVKDVTMPGMNTVAMSERCVAADFTPFAPDILRNLSTALCFPDLPDNPYLMSCLLRVLGITNISGPVVHDTVTCLVGILKRSCNNPNNSNFSYYLFEALVAVTRQADGQDPALMAIFNNSLLPVVVKITDPEFWPYVIQIRAESVNLGKPPMAELHKELYNSVLLNLSFWEKPPCVPSLVCLLQAFLKKFPDELDQNFMLPKIMEFSCMLLTLINYEDSTFRILNTIVQSVSEKVIQQYMPTIMSTLFSRLSRKKAVAYHNSVGLFMALVVEKFGFSLLMTSIHIKYSNLLEDFLEVFWIPNMKLIKEPQKAKQAAVFSIKLLCAYQGLLATSSAKMWSNLFDSTLTVLSDQDEEKNGHDESLRIAVAKDSQIWETLNICLKDVNIESLDLLVRRLDQIIKSNIGLNTGVGVAIFITLLVQKVMVDIKPYAPSLLRSLYSAVLDEKNYSAKRAFASSCAAVLKYASLSQAQKLIEDTASLHLGEKNAQLSAAVLFKAYLSNAEDILSESSSLVVPVIFASRFDDDKEIGALYGELWDDISNSERETLQQHLSGIVPLLSVCMHSSSWADKRKSAKAIRRLCDALGESLPVHYNNTLQSLLKELPV